MVDVRPIPTLIFAATVAELSPVAHRLRLSRGEGSWGKDQTLFAATTGVGPRRASLAAERWIEKLKPSRVLITGTVGATNPAHRCADIISPEIVIDAATGRKLTPTWPADTSGTLWSGDAIISTPGDKARLHRESGVDVVDMETAAIALVCERCSIPWLCVRAVLDPADASLPPGLDTLIGEHGQTRTFTAAGYAIRHPWCIPALIKLGRDTTLAMSAAAERIATLL